MCVLGCNPGPFEAIWFESKLADVISILVKATRLISDQYSKCSDYELSATPGHISSCGATRFNLRSGYRWIKFYSVSSRESQSYSQFKIESRCPLV